MEASQCAVILRTRAWLDARFVRGLFFPLFGDPGQLGEPSLDPDGELSSSWRETGESTIPAAKAAGSGSGSGSGLEGATLGGVDVPLPSLETTSSFFCDRNAFPRIFCTSANGCGCV
jgi:hypothetical protein